MSELLDTNVLIRLLIGQPLPPIVERTLVAPDVECYVSVVSAWEIRLKPKLGLTAHQIEAGIEALGIMILPLRFTHLEELEKLPVHDDHRDPFDRLLIAQAISEGLRMISSDRRFPQYRRLRLLWK